MSKLYTETKIKLHPYSRSPLAEGQINFDQAGARSGHTVSFEDVRGEEIPIIENNEARKQALFIDNNGNKFVKKEFSSHIEFIENGLLSAIPGTNYESFYIFVNKNDREEIVKNWIDPSDKSINSYTLSDGYEIKLISESNNTEISRNYGWEFDSFNGILHFSPEFKPYNPDGSFTENWINAGFDKPIIQGFIYIGQNIKEVMSRSFNEVNENISNLENKTFEIMNAALAIQPIKFSTCNMSSVDKPYQKESLTNDTCVKYYQKLCIDIPYYCFDLFLTANNEKVLTEIHHLENGHSEIYLDVLWDCCYERPIVGHTLINNSQIPLIGHIEFTAYAFAQNDGKPIKTLSTLCYDNVDPEISTPIQKPTISACDCEMCIHKNTCNYNCCKCNN